MQVPHFSIIIPTHARASLLRRALQSVRNNAFADYELLVIADSIDAETHQVAAELLSERDTFIKRTGVPGPAESRNLGMQLARGHYILFLDDDDAFLPTYLAEAHQATQQNPDRVLYTNFRIIQEDRLNPGKGPLDATDYSVGDVDFEGIHVKNFIQNHTAIYPQAAVRGKKQDPSLTSLEDWDFLLNVVRHSPFSYCNIRGAVTFKDYVNPGNRRGTTVEAIGAGVVPNYLSIYRKWPAPNEALREKRRELLASMGVGVPKEWL